MEELRSNDILNWFTWIICTFTNKKTSFPAVVDKFKGLPIDLQFPVPSVQFLR